LTEIILNTSLIDVVAEKIRNNILDGTYEPGQKLIVRNIENEMNVSQTPIKAALHRLAAEGYVEALPRRSMIVRRVTYDEYEWNMEMRLILELSVIPEVIKCSIREPSFIADMESHYDRLKDVLERASDERIDYSEWLKHDFSFHSCFVDVHPNLQLRATYAGLRAHMSSFFAFLNDAKHPLTAKHFGMDNTEHMHILAAIKSHDADQLATAVMRHISRPRIHQKGASDVQQRVARFIELYNING